MTLNLMRLAGPALSHSPDSHRHNGLDLSGFAWHCRDLGRLLLHLADRDEAIRRRRLDRGQDPEPARPPLPWFGPPQGRPVDADRDGHADQFTPSYPTV
jgi:hypothetical protein